MNELQIINEDQMKMLDVYAASVLKSGIVPTGINSVEKVKIIMLTGHELGMKPMESLTNLFVVNGRGSMMAQNMLSLIRKNCQGAVIKQNQVTPQICEIEASRDGKNFEKFSFSIEDAKRAGLLGKAIWQQYPQDMLWARAVSRMARRLFSDILAGATHTPEELGAEVNESGTPKSSYSAPGDAVNERTQDIQGKLEGLKDVTPAAIKAVVKTAVTEGPVTPTAPPPPAEDLKPLDPIESAKKADADLKAMVKENKEKAKKKEPKKEPVKVIAAPPAPPPSTLNVVSDEVKPPEETYFDSLPDDPNEQIDDYGSYIMPAGTLKGKTLREIGKAKVTELATKTIAAISNKPKDEVKQSTFEFLTAAEMFLEQE